MLRWVKYGILAVLVVFFLILALANRQPVDVTLFTPAVEHAAGFNYSVTLPLWLVASLAVALGLLIGFIWEWIREHKHRTEAATKRSEARQLKRQVDDMKTKKAKDEGKDEVLALLEDAGPAR